MRIFAGTRRQELKISYLEKKFFFKLIAHRLFMDEHGGIARSPLMPLYVAFQQTHKF